ncbi:iron ABC transporter permease [Roseomonas sp. 18066]|uniref:FecCD family ABC transporter permease n=1 Tax=Roseomonas sp. 18066 TaxID=2681412 RepID=UPI001358B776|nr:iron ABC transporter permease [Roseomonas sp. 18066]
MTAPRSRPLLWLGALALLAVLLSLGLGRFSLPPATVLRILLAPLLPIEPDWPRTAEIALLQVRLPRIGVALLVGASLAIGGATYQGVFRNPLVSPFVLGVSAGAGFGAALAILLDGGALAIQASAFGFAVLATLATTALGRACRGNRTLVLVLSGIIVASVFTALLGLLKYSADPENKLPVIEYWLLGSLSGVRAPVFWGLLALNAPLLALLLALRWRLNLLAMGDEAARALGVRLGLERALQLGLATALASSAVAVCGLVGWVGLVVPHLGRLLVGADHDRLLPATLLIGGSFLLLADTLARSLSAAEIPLGIVTSLLGAPVFAALLLRGEKSWT